MPSAIISQPTFAWATKYKLYHLPFWLTYHYLLSLIIFGNPVAAASSLFFTPLVIKFSFYLFFQLVAVYFTLYFLIPRYLEKGRYTLYLGYVALTALTASTAILPGYYISAHVAGKPLMEMYWSKGNPYIYYLFASTLPSTIAAMTLAMSIKLGKNWLQTKRRQQLLEKEKLETELRFLKYQFNPHFLFNSINSIFFLIHKNPDKASASLAKFSDLLRHQLYECNEHQISLSKEIDYLDNFIELERLRQNTNVQVETDIVKGHTGHLGIAPFILMTFTENAFKHISRHEEAPNWIQISLQVEGEAIYFRVANSTAAQESRQAIHYGGIGLQNVQRRLDLLYPGKYQLQIKHEEEVFEVKLWLTLTSFVAADTLAPQPDLSFVA